MSASPEVSTFVNVDCASDPEYRAVLEEIQLRNVCPLDIEEYRRTSEDNILRQLGGWVLSRTSKPYENTEQDLEGVVGHMLIFPERHLVSPDEMTRADVLSLWRMFKIARNDFGAATGGFGMRYSSEGNHFATSLSINHLHAHIMVPHIVPETGRAPLDANGGFKQVMFDIG
jgi:hypothetical protein